MAEQEKVGRQRLGVLVALKERLIALETEATVLYAKGHERHDRATVDLEGLAEIVARLEADPPVAALMLSDAEQRLEKAGKELTEAQSVLDDLKAKTP